MDVVTYALCKKHIADTLAGAGSLSGKSAYEIAQEAGYTGTQEEWLNSLKGTDGKTPYIGENGNWWIGELDTGVVAEGGRSEAIPAEVINNLFPEGNKEVKD